MEDKVAELGKQMAKVVQLLERKEEFKRRRNRLPTWEDDESRWWRRRRRSTMRDWPPAVQAFFYSSPVEEIGDDDLSVLKVDDKDADIEVSEDDLLAAPVEDLPPPPPKPPDPGTVPLKLRELSIATENDRLKVEEWVVAEMDRISQDSRSPLLPLEPPDSRLSLTTVRERKLGLGRTWRDSLEPKKDDPEPPSSRSAATTCGEREGDFGRVLRVLIVGSATHGTSTAAQLCLIRGSANTSSAKLILERGKKKGLILTLVGSPKSRLKELRASEFVMEFLDQAQEILGMMGVVTKGQEMRYLMGKTHTVKIKGNKIQGIKWTKDIHVRPIFNLGIEMWHNQHLMLPYIILSMLILGCVNPVLEPHHFFASAIGETSRLNGCSTVQRTAEAPCNLGRDATEKNTEVENEESNMACKELLDWSLEWGQNKWVDCNWISLGEVKAWNPEFELVLVILGQAQVGEDNQSWCVAGETKHGLWINLMRMIQTIRMTKSNKWAINRWESIGPIFKVHEVTQTIEDWIKGLSSTSITPKNQKARKVHIHHSHFYQLEVADRNSATIDEVSEEEGEGTIEFKFVKPKPDPSWCTSFFTPSRVKTSSVGHGDSKLFLSSPSSLRRKGSRRIRLKECHHIVHLHPYQRSGNASTASALSSANKPLPANNFAGITLFNFLHTETKFKDKWVACLLNPSLPTKIIGGISILCSIEDSIETKEGLVRCILSFGDYNEEGALSLSDFLDQIDIVSSQLATSEKNDLFKGTDKVGDAVGEHLIKISYIGSTVLAGSVFDSTVNMLKPVQQALSTLAGHGVRNSMSSHCRHWDHGILDYIPMIIYSFKTWDPGGSPYSTIGFGFSYTHLEDKVVLEGEGIDRNCCKINGRGKLGIDK